MSDRFSSASTQICPVEVPVFLANAETPPALLNGIYKALFHDRHDVIAAPVEYDFLRSTPAEALQAIDGRLNSGESPLMMFEWQWEQPMLEVLSLVSRKRQPALFIKPGSGERVKRVQVLIGGGHRSIENLKMAWKIAQHLKASIVAIRVIDPAWVRYDERLGRV